MRSSSIVVLLLAVAALLLPMGLPTSQAPRPAAAQAVPNLIMLPDCDFYPDGEFLFLPPETETLNETMVCGVLETLEDPLNADSELIEIAFVILFSNASNPRPDPLIYLEGGPGGSAILGIDDWVESEFREEFDIILVDQRGTGYSAPSLSCLAYVDYDDYEYDDEYYAACIDELQALNLDFAAYHTVNNATDIAYLIEALQEEFDYGQANLLGISYGTRLGLALMRDWPELIRAAVLDSVYPPEADAYGDDVRNTGDALSALIVACQAVPDCDAAFPNLEDDLLELIDALYANPVPIEDEDYGEYDYTGYDLVLDLFYAQYGIDFVRGMPAAIYYGLNGDIETLQELLYEGPPGFIEEYPDYYSIYSTREREAYFEAYDLLYDADGMFQLLECQEEIAYSNASPNRLPMPRIAFSDVLLADLESGLFDSIEACDIWVYELAPEAETRPVQSDVPALLLSGSLDPITPPRWAEAASRSLSNGYFVEVPFAAHAVIEAGDCPMQIVFEFLDDPSRPPDTSCVAAMVFEFYIPPELR